MIPVNGLDYSAPSKVNNDRKRRPESTKTFINYINIERHKFQSYSLNILNEIFHVFSHSTAVNSSTGSEVFLKKIY